MDGFVLLALVTAVAMAAYLIVALMKPEWFS